MNKQNFLLSIFTLIIPLVTACSTVTVRKEPIDVNEYLADATFNGYDKIKIESEQDIFQLPTDVIAKVKRKASKSRPPHEQVDHLVEHIIGKPNKDIAYSSLADLTASQAYENKTANCLSLSILAYSLAEIIGIEAQFQRVLIPEIWTKQNRFTLINGHVNVKLTAEQKLNHLRIAPTSRYSDVYRSINSYTETLDFSPELARQPFKKHQISKQTVQAFFYNNKAAQALMARDNTLAYRYLRSSLMLEQNDAAAWTNLGLLYKREGLLDLAEKVFNKAIEQEPDKLSVYDNLLVLYRETGRENLALDIQQRLEKKRKNNPYYHALKGESAYELGDMNEAILRYKKAIVLNNEDNQFYWGLAKSYFELGDLDNTEKYLTRAKQLANFDDLEERYQNKLNALKHLAYAD